MKIVIATPTVSRPHDAYLAALEASVPALDAAGIDHSTVFEIGCPYISSARAQMLAKAMKHGADVVMFIDHDVAWDPPSLLKVLQTPDDVVCGTYRYKRDHEEYMGTHCVYGENNLPLVRASDGAIEAVWVPAGFLKVTRAAIEKFSRYFPELLYGPDRDHVDLFNHGAHRGIWYGEDYAFSRNWHTLGGEIWLVPDLNLDHHSPQKCYSGNYHRFLRRRPGGAEAPVVETFQQQSVA